MEKPEDMKVKYRRRVLDELNRNLKSGSSSSPEGQSKDYSDFLSDFKSRKKTLYEKACGFSEKFGITPDPITSAKLQKAADFANLQITPKGAYSFALAGPLLFILSFGLLVFALFPNPYFTIALVFLGGILAIYPLMNLPFYISDNYRLQASNQMVLSIFYIVTYMRHTSNLERAIEFASDHLSAPLSTEFRKLIWDVESGKYETINHAINEYLETWKDLNPEFVDAMHLIQSSLLEGYEDRRIESLDKSLNLILDETYEKMLHYAHNLQSPITTLHMLGIILPILGLVILPLVTSFLGDSFKWYDLAVLYDIFLPVAVFLFGLKMLSKRPSGYGETALDSKEIKEAYKETVKIGKIDTGVTPKLMSWTVGLLLFLIGILPIFMYFVGMTDFGFGEMIDGNSCGKEICFLERRTDTETGVVSGPYGVPASILSLFTILGMGLGLGLYYKLRSKKVVAIFDKSKTLEREFSSTLFQLGSRLGDNVPAEVAAINLAQSLPNSDSGNFFNIIGINIQKLGLSLAEAIYNPSVGAMIYYPSKLLDSAMSVLVQSAKKGPLIASNAILNISKYIKSMHNVEERLRDLMAEVISSMKSQINFLTPIISAVVVSLTSMIGNILGILSARVGGLLNDVGSEGGGMSPQMLLTFFKGSFPTFYFIIIVGIYVVEITFILTVIVNVLQNGSDTIHKEYMLGENLTKATTIFVIVSGVLMIGFYFIVQNIMPMGAI